jgi:uncharacterized membrane protein
LIVGGVRDAAAAVTFVRFVPAMKARYDYGLSIFILTFCMISISSYGKHEHHEMIKMAHQRLATIILGSFVAIVICICICPVWIGENLHNLAATNMEKLGNFLEGIYIYIYTSKIISIRIYILYKPYI